MLSKIERGVASPTIGLLCKISAALGVPLTRLVAEPEGVQRRLIRHDEMATIQDALSGVTRWSLSTELPEWGLELLRYEIAPGGSTGEAGSCGAGTREIFYVTAGTIEVHCQGRHDTVRAGETLLLDSTGAACGYVIRNPSDVVSQLVLVVDRRKKPGAL